MKFAACQVKIYKNRRNFYTQTSVSKDWKLTASTDSSSLGDVVLLPTEEALSYGIQRALVNRIILI